MATFLWQPGVRKSSLITLPTDAFPKSPGRIYICRAILFAKWRRTVQSWLRIMVRRCFLIKNLGNELGMKNVGTPWWKDELSYVVFFLLIIFSRIFDGATSKCSPLKDGATVILLLQLSIRWSKKVLLFEWYFCYR